MLAQHAAYHACDGTPDRLRPAHRHGRAAAAARRLVQARAPRTDDDRRAQRRRQDHAAARAGGGDHDRPRRAERRPRRADRPARPASTARAGTAVARVHPVGLHRGAADRGASSPSWRARMAVAGTADEATLDRYARAQARLETHGGYLWRDRATAMAHGLGFVDADLDRALDTFSGGAAHARLAGPRARHRRGRAAAGRAHEPSRHRVAGVARADARLPRRGRRAGRPRPLVPGGRRHVRARAGGRHARRFFAGTWHAWRREQAAREIALGKAIDKQQAEIARMERFIERFRYKATKARQAQSRVKKLAKIERIERDPRDEQGLEFAFKAPERSGRVVFELTDALIDVGGAGAAVDHPARAGRAVARARRARLARGAERLGQDDADRDPRRAPSARAGQAQHRAQRDGRLSLPARRRARRGRSIPVRACSTPPGAPRA